MSLPLVAAQRGIWVADQISPFQNAYVIAHFLDIQGDLSPELLCKAVTQGMEEADTLQMQFKESNGEPRQIFIGSSLLPQPECEDLRAEEDALSAAHAFMHNDLERNMRLLGANSLIRHKIMQVGDNRWIWYQRYHHVQLDAFSFTALTRRMVDIYSAILRHEKIEPNPFDPISDVIQEYEVYGGSQKRIKDATYWKEISQALPEASTLSTLPIAGQQASTNVLRQVIDLDGSKTAHLVSVGKTVGIKDVDILLALIAVWLMRLTGRNTIGVGFIFMRRLGSAALNSTCPVINVLPMCFELKENDSIFSVATRVAKTINGMRRHQYYDAEQIVRDSNRLWDSDPLYGPVINFKAFDYNLDFAGVQCSTHHLASGPVRDIEIALYAGETGDYHVEILANAERYASNMIESHLKRLNFLLRQLAENPDLLCDQTSLLLPDEQELIVKTNATETPYDEDTLASLVQKQARITPELPALLDKNYFLTYGQMNSQANGLAQQLFACGVIPGDIVAVALPRSIFLAISLQAIVLLGAVWLPLDIGYPQDRLNWMLEDAKPKVVVTNADQVDKLPPVRNTRVIYYESLISAQANSSFPIVKPDQNAYIIYTSGSTGRPKGVLINHRAVVNRLRWMQSQYGLEANDRVLQKTPSSFDVSVWEFFWPLITGAQLVMAPPEAHRDPEQLERLISEYQITTIHFVPSMLATFLQTLHSCENLKSLRRVFCSGEALPTDLARAWQQETQIPLHNLYGPTEAAIDVSFYPAFGETLAAIKRPTVPIGLPVWNTSLHVLDANMQPVPLYGTGELFIAGIQLASGYLHRPELTARYFISDHKGRRLYRTRDLCRRLENGAIEFIGRSDDQVKIRGQRIELNEIDEVLKRLDGVSQAATVPQTLSQSSVEDFKDARQLVSYVVPEAGINLDEEIIIQRAAQSLPPYMVPKMIVFMHCLPLGMTGKLNRRALPVPDFAWQQQHKNNSRPPAPGLEQKIAQAFSYILECDRVLADDDFFSLGGHSLLAVRLAALLRRELKLPVDIGQIMQTSKVSSLAAQLSDSENQNDWRNAGYQTMLSFRQSEARFGGPTLFCIHPASGFAWQFSILQRYLDRRWSLVGVQSAYQEGPLTTSESLEKLIESQYQVIRQYQPFGPYGLIGYSLGGTIAHGVAAKLKNAGAEVKFLGLLDTWPPETQNWDEKQKKNVVDQAVIDEMQREREEFYTAQQGLFDSSKRMFDVIEQNYGSAVRLLATARSSYFDGKATAFVAQRTLPNNTDIREVWSPWNKSIQIVPVDCSHVDIISPRTFKTLGLQINDILSTSFFSG